MRNGAFFIVLVLITAVLSGLAELLHDVVLWDLDRAIPTAAPLVRGTLVALCIAPLLWMALRSYDALRTKLLRAEGGLAAMQARDALIGQALHAGQFAVYEIDVDAAVLRVLGGGPAFGQRDGDTGFDIEDWLLRCHPDDAPVVRAGYEALCAGIAPEFEHAYRIRTASGDWRWIRVRAHVSLHDAAGRARRIVGAACDVTDERDAERRVGHSERLLHAVLDLLPVGVFWKDRAGRYLGANRAFLEYYGRGAVVGLVDADFVGPAEAARFAAHDAAVIERGVEERNTLRETTGADGRSHWYITNKVALRDDTGQVIGVVGTFDDVTSLKDTERRLRETSERFELALRGSSDGLWDWNLVTDEVYYSPRFKALLGYGADEYGNDFAAYDAGLHPDDRAAVHAAIQGHLHGVAEVEVEYRMRHRSGEWRWYLTRGLTIRDPDGKARRMAGTLSDITERKLREVEVATARGHLLEAIEALDSGIVMFDAERRLVFCNSRYREFYRLPASLARPGTPYADLIAHFFECFPERRRDRSPAEYAEALFARHREGGRPWDFELAGRWLLVSERPTQEGGVVCLHTEVSRLKHTQRALEEAVRRAESANQAKSQFVANVSHELRTPLNGVLGMLQLLEDGKLEAPHDEYVRVALQAGRALLDLINDILDFSRNEAGNGSVANEVVNLPLFIDEIVAAHARRAVAKGLQLLPFVDPAVPQRVRGDPARLGQVLSNLLGNAIKFTERGEVRLDVKPDPETIDGLCFVVEDTGIGIALELQDTIFEPFTQGDGSHTRRHGGTGLGLALARQQLALMGGSVSLESAPGEGSRFTCRLTLEPVAAEPTAQAGGTLRIGPWTPCLPALLASLARAGSEVLDCEDAAVAVDMLERGLPPTVDHVFVDAGLPPSVLLRVVRAATARGMPCTAYGVPVDAELPATLRATFAGVLRTPLTYAAVQAALQPPTRAHPLSTVVEAVDAEVASRLADTLGPTGMVELVETFHRGMQQRLADYRQALEARDGARVQRLGQAMQGMGTNLGAARFSTLCDEVCRRAALGDMPDRCAELNEAFAIAIAQLRAVADRSRDMAARRARG